MENNFEILPLFPTPLYVHNIPPSLSKVIPFFDSQLMGGNDGEQNIYGHRSKDSYILDKPECLDLSNYIISKAKYFALEILNFEYSSYKFSQSWITHKHPNESHRIHTHPNSLISGVLYYGKITNSTSHIEFHKGSSFPDNQSILLPKYDDNASPTIFSSPSFSFKPNSGDLILFPSYLRHSVPTNTTNEVRKSLAFNIVPTKGFGDEPSLCELKF